MGKNDIDCIAINQGKIIHLRNIQPMRFIFLTLSFSVLVLDPLAVSLQSRINRSAPNGFVRFRIFGRDVSYRVLPARRKHVCSLAAGTVKCRMLPCRWRSCRHRRRSCLVETHRRMRVRRANFLAYRRRGIPRHRRDSLLRRRPDTRRPRCAGARRFCRPRRTI